MGSQGKKKKNSRRGCIMSCQRQTLKNADLGTYIKGNMGKAPKMYFFANFDPFNLKTEKMK
jgi:hypothetical protein